MAKIGDKVNPQRLQSFQKEVSRTESLASSVDWGLLLRLFVWIGLIGVGWFSGGFSGRFYLNAISATTWSGVIAGTIIGISVGTLLLLVALNLFWMVRQADTSERFYGTSIASIVGGGVGAIGGAIVAATAGTRYLEMISATAWGRILISSLVGALAGTVALVGLMRVLGEIGLRIFSFFPLESVQEPLKWRALLPPHESFLAILLYELPFLFWVGGLSGAIAGAVFSQF